MDIDSQLLMAAETIRENDFLIRCMVEMARPFANAANAQQHTDCGGHIKQSDWEQVAQLVAAADQDVALEILRATPATHGH